MDVFTRWEWIKRNWPHILGEAQSLGLVFVGGTALNLIIFDEYRASEDIDLYNPDSKGPDNPDGISEEGLAKMLSEKLAEKGFEIKNLKGRAFYIGPNIRVEIFHDATHFKKINKINKDGVIILIFDLNTYMEMKMAALLCRTVFGPKDLVDIFILNEHGKVKPIMPDRECDVIEHSFNQRVNEIGKIKTQDLLLFQSKQQIDSLPYAKFEEFKRWFVEWLSSFS